MNTENRFKQSFRFLIVTYIAFSVCAQGSAHQVSELSCTAANPPKMAKHLTLQDYDLFGLDVERLSLNLINDWDPNVPGGDWGPYYAMNITADFHNIPPKGSVTGGNLEAIELANHVEIKSVPTAGDHFVFVDLKDSEKSLKSTSDQFSYKIMSDNIIGSTTIFATPQYPDGFDETGKLIWSMTLGEHGWINRPELPPATFISPLFDRPFVGHCTAIREYRSSHDTVKFLDIN